MPRKDWIAPYREWYRAVEAHRERNAFLIVNGLGSNHPYLPFQYSDLSDKRHVYGHWDNARATDCVFVYLDTAVYDFDAPTGADQDVGSFDTFEDKWQFQSEFIRRDIQGDINISLGPLVISTPAKKTEIVPIMYVVDPSSAEAVEFLVDLMVKHGRIARTGKLPIIHAKAIVEELVRASHHMESDPLYYEAAIMVCARVDRTVLDIEGLGLTGAKRQEMLEQLDQYIKDAAQEGLIGAPLDYTHQLDATDDALKAVSDEMTLKAQDKLLKR